MYIDKYKYFLEQSRKNPDVSREILALSIKNLKKIVDLKKNNKATIVTFYKAKRNVYNFY